MKKKIHPHKFSQQQQKKSIKKIIKILISWKKELNKTI